MRLPKFSAAVGTFVFVWFVGCDGKTETQPTPPMAAALPSDGGGEPDAPPSTLHDIDLSLSARDVAFDDATLFVLDVTGQVTAVDRVSEASRPLVDQVANGTPISVAVCGDSVYWTEVAAGRISRVSKGGGPVEAILTGLHRPWGLACDATQVYWTELGEAGAAPGHAVVASAPLEGGARTILADALESTQGIALTDDALIFTANVPGDITVKGNVPGHAEVRRVPKNGGPITVLASGTFGGERLQIRNDTLLLWWGDFYGGAYTVPLGGGSATKVASWPAANITFAGDRFIYEVRYGTDATVHVELEAFPGAPTEIGSDAYPDAIAIGTGTAALSDERSVYLVDVWNSMTDAAPHTVIHVIAP